MKEEQKEMWLKFDVQENVFLFGVWKEPLGIEWPNIVVRYGQHLCMTCKSLDSEACICLSRDKVEWNVFYNILYTIVLINHGELWLAIGNTKLVPSLAHQSRALRESAPLWLCSAHQESLTAAPPRAVTRPPISHDIVSTGVFRKTNSWYRPGLSSR